MAETNEVSLTSGGVEFAPWGTEVADDDLTFMGVSYLPSESVDFPADGFGLTLPDAFTPSCHELEALFLSREKRATVRFEFRNVRAFRVLDEAGLTELWGASARTPRPTQTTFRVRGHAWQDESILEWIMGADPDYFSHVVATGFECLEVVCRGEPIVEIGPAIVRSLESERPG